MTINCIKYNVDSTQRNIVDRITSSFAAEINSSCIFVV